MSINDINNAAAAMNQLKARYEGFLDDADGEIGVRQAAYDVLANNLIGVVQGLALQTLYVDPVNGSDANSGTNVGSALASLPAAYAKALPRGELRIRIIGENADASFDGSVNCLSSRLSIGNTVGGTDTSTFPIISSGTTILSFGAFEIAGVNLDSSAGSIFKGFGHTTVKTLRVDITAGDFPVFTQHSSEPSHMVLNMTHTHVTDAAGATSPKLMIANTWDFTGTSISIPSGKSWGDYLNVVRAADGEPRNGLSNLVI